MVVPPYPAENKDQEISYMNISVHAVNTTVDISICIAIEDIKTATEEDAELQMLKRYIIKRWPHTKEGVGPGLEKYWPIRHALGMIYGIAIKGKQIIISFLFQRKILRQLHSNHMGIKKMQLSVR